MSAIRVAVITASTREGRFGDTVSAWFLGRAQLQPGFVIDAIDLAHAGLPAALPTENDAATEAYRQRIAAADAVVMITPEYNHSYPASLKQAIDLLRDEWYAKPVAFVSYGGQSGGIRAVHHLRAVMPEVHAMTIRNAISLHNVWGLFDDSGSFRQSERYDKSVDAMFGQLGWWAQALSAARSALPYAA